MNFAFPLTNGQNLQMEINWIFLQLTTQRIVIAFANYKIIIEYDITKKMELNQKSCLQKSGSLSSSLHKQLFLN